MIIETASIETPAGQVRIATRGGRIVRACFSDHWDQAVERTCRRFPDDDWVDIADPAGVVSALRRYLEGDLTAVDGLEVDLGGTPFQQRVWTALRAIPVGETRSYADVALAAGAPGAVRAVGSANGANPVWLVVPCHRVIRSDGTLGGYGGGLDRKAWLLRHEGARLV